MVLYDVEDPGVSQFWKKSVEWKEDDSVIGVSWISKKELYEVIVGKMMFAGMLEG